MRQMIPCERSVKLGPLKQSTNKLAEKNVYFLAELFTFFFFFNFVFPDSAIFKNLLFILCMERNLQTEIKFIYFFFLNYRNLREKRRFWLFTILQYA